MNSTIKLITFLTALSVAAFFSACGGSGNSSDSQSEDPSNDAGGIIQKNPMMNKGIGPISSVTLGEEIDEAMAADGAVIYEAKCTACHKPTVKHIGPPPQGILERRSPEWVMNMILNPEEMVQKDEIAKNLFIEFNGSPMANQNLTEEEARKVLEYFRTL